MGIFQVFLVLAAFLCSLVAGFLFAFAVVVMPGIKRLGNSEYIRVFQAMDGIIQDNQPIFIMVWLGSVIALIVTAVSGIRHLDFTGLCLLIFATLAYLLCVQLPTMTVNVPLNNRLQSLEVDVMDASAQATAREVFEKPWNRWNAIRTVSSCLTSVLLLILLLRY